MTTIAYRDGVLAGDSATYGNYIFRGYSQKVFKVRGHLIGWAGTKLVGQTFMRWFRDGCNFDRPPKFISDHEAMVLVITPKGWVQEWTQDLAYSEYKCKFYAVGTGGDIALGTMLMGASAVEAVRLVKKLDPFTAGSIRSVSL